MDELKKHNTVFDTACPENVFVVRFQNQLYLEKHKPDFYFL